MVSMQKYLNGVLTDFRAYVESGVSLCPLKDTHFDGGKLPDYSDPHVQQLYLLRYTCAYAFEYKQMYRTLLQRIPPEQPLEILSIGCGNLVDYWALTQVSGEKRPLRYLGLDVIDWCWRFYPRRQDQVEFLQTDVLEYLQNVPELTADIYMFPKSISEFSFEDFGTLCQRLGGKLTHKDKVHFLFSLRTDAGSLHGDTVKTAYLYEAMRRQGFSSQDGPENTLSLPEAQQNQKLYQLDRDFLYPNAGIDFLKNLHTRCNHYREQGASCQADCANRLDRWPVLSCKKMLWRIYTFERDTRPA